MVATTLLLLTLAVACRAARDAQSHTPARGVNRFAARLRPRWRRWLDSRTSWLNKYADRDPRRGPAFLFSTTALVWTTDFWHFSQFVATTAQLVAVALWMAPTAGWWTLSLLAPALVFEPLYRFLRQ